MGPERTRGGSLPDKRAFSEYYALCAREKQFLLDTSWIDLQQKLANEITEAFLLRPEAKLRVYGGKLDIYYPKPEPVDAFGVKKSERAFFFKCWSSVRRQREEDEDEDEDE
jgi:hypothetical protein